MKKLLAIILCLGLIFSFAACGETATKDKKDSGKKETSTPVEKEEIKEEVKIETPATVKEGKLIMATNAYFKPYEYYENEKIVGIDAEIAAKIAEKLGLELVIEDMSFDSIISAVNTDAVDFGMAGMTETPARLKEVDFSVSYASGVQSIIVPENSKITSADDLSADGAAYKVGVQLGTTGDLYSTDDFGKERVTQYPNGNEAVVALKGGDVDCVIIDNQPAKSLVENNAGLKILETPYADEDYAICIKKGNTALKNAVDAALEQLIEDGTVDEILAKYIH